MESFTVNPTARPSHLGIQNVVHTRTQLSLIKLEHRLLSFSSANSICLSLHTYAFSLIISVTGGAESFEVPPGLLGAIRNGLVRAARSKDAWIISGGTNTGVMRLVGECIKPSQSESPIPLIGIGKLAYLFASLIDMLDVKLFHRFILQHH
jgi:hypothetical protein